MLSYSTVLAPHAEAIVSSPGGQAVGLTVLPQLTLGKINYKPLDMYKAWLKCKLGW